MRERTVTRKKLVFGGDNLRGTQWTWYYHPFTGDAQVHGHPGDDALILTPDEVKELRIEMWAGIPHDHGVWDAEHRERYHAITRSRVIAEISTHGGAHNAAKYVRDKQAEYAECDVDPREWLGLKPKKRTKAATPAANREKNHGD